MIPSNADLREAISEILVKWSMPTRQAAINEILALFQAREQQLLAEVLSHRQTCHDCTHDDENLETIDFVPVSAIQRLQNKTNDGGRDE